MSDVTSIYHLPWNLDMRTRPRRLGSPRPVVRRQSGTFEMLVDTEAEAIGMATQVLDEVFGDYETSNVETNQEPDSGMWRVTLDVTATR